MREILHICINDNNLNDNIMETTTIYTNENGFLFTIKNGRVVPHVLDGERINRAHNQNLYDVFVATEIDGHAIDDVLVDVTAHTDAIASAMATTPATESGVRYWIDSQTRKVGRDQLAAIFKSAKSGMAA